MDTEQKPFRNNIRRRKKVCAFCADKVEFIDFKNADKLRKYISERGKILPRRVMGTCARHQRELTTAIKRARQVALLPYDAEVTRLQKAKHFATAKPEPAKVEEPVLNEELVDETVETAVEEVVAEETVENTVEATVEEFVGDAAEEAAEAVTEAVEEKAE